MAHGRNLFIVSRHLDYPPNLSISRLGTGTFRCCYPSADEDLVIWTNNCDRKARTGKYLGLSSDYLLIISENGWSEDCWEGVVLGLRVLVRAREDSRERGGEVFGSAQGAR